MYLKKGKVEFGYKDTYNLDTVLSEVILSGLVKFHNVLKEKDKAGKAYGVPYFEEIGEDVEKASEKWFDILSKMIYAFDEKNEPDITKYNICFNLDIENKRLKYNQENYDKYLQDLQLYQEKKQEGLNLFAKHYESLWW